MNKTFFNPPLDQKIELLQWNIEKNLGMSKRHCT